MSSAIFMGQHCRHCIAGANCIAGRSVLKESVYCSYQVNCVIFYHLNKISSFRPEKR